MDSGTLVVIVVLLVGTIFGLNRMRTDGRVNIHAGTQRVNQSELGHDMGARATIIQFSSPYCQPCKAAHDLIAGHAAQHEGVTHIDLQVADHLDMVNKLHVLRTPTTVILDSKGSVRYRTEGVPRAEEFAEALETVLAH